MLTSLTELSGKTEELKAQMKTLAMKAVKPALKEAFVELKTAVPSLIGVRWRQYTPHFNDGDECIFRVNEPYFQLDTPDTKPEDSDYEDGFYGIWLLENKKLTTAKTVKVFEKFESTLNGIEEMLKLSLGDHAMVTVTESGIEVEEYEHD